MYVYGMVACTYLFMIYNLFIWCTAVVLKLYALEDMIPLYTIDPNNYKKIKLSQKHI